MQTFISIAFDLYESFNWAKINYLASWKNVEPSTSFWVGNFFRS